MAQLKKFLFGEKYHDLLSELQAIRTKIEEQEQKTFQFRQRISKLENYDNK